jgi:hypothetical protein
VTANWVWVGDDGRLTLLAGTADTVCTPYGGIIHSPLGLNHYWIQIGDLSGTLVYLGDPHGVS